MAGGMAQERSATAASSASLKARSMVAERTAAAISVRCRKSKSLGDVSVVGVGSDGSDAGTLAAAGQKWAEERGIEARAGSLHDTSTSAGRRALWRLPLVGRRLLVPSAPPHHVGDLTQPAMPPLPSTPAGWNSADAEAIGVLPNGVK